ncbi:hypothetical protein I5F60_16020, partial [Pseudomonas aeruginosa]|nr:hypothetical protein [Pseudomonas aeruginosa]
MAEHIPSGPRPPPAYRLDNRNGGLVSADGGVTAEARQIDNRGGEI